MRPFGFERCQRQVLQVTDKLFPIISQFKADENRHVHVQTEL